MEPTPPPDGTTPSAVRAWELFTPVWRGQGQPGAPHLSPGDDRRLAFRVAEADRLAAVSHSPERGHDVLAHHRLRQSAWLAFMSGPHGYTLVRDISSTLPNGGPEWTVSLWLTRPIVSCFAAALHACGLTIEARLTAALAASRCPHCAHPLRGEPSGPQADLVRCLSACPECGYAWPLLPPEV